MRKHLITYCKENYGLLQVLLCEQLTQCKITLQQYLCLMEGTPTCGYEITFLILSQMFNIAIPVISSGFLVGVNISATKRVSSCNNSEYKWQISRYKINVWCTPCKCWHCSKDISKQKAKPHSRKKFHTK